MGFQTNFKIKMEEDHHHELLSPSFLVELRNAQPFQAPDTTGRWLSAPSFPVCRLHPISSPSQCKLFLPLVGCFPWIFCNMNKESTFGHDSSVEYRNTHSSRCYSTLSPYYSVWITKVASGHISPSPGLYSYISSSGLVILNYFISS